MDAVDSAVFPSLQGGPHNHQIAALAVALKEAATPEFRTYARQVCSNAAALADKLSSLGMTIATGGTENHLILWDLKPQGISGSKFEKTCDAVSITLNKNCVPGDKSAITPGGVRIGTPALTTRSFDEEDFEKVAMLLVETLDVALKIQEKSGPKLKDFIPLLENNEELMAIREKVHSFASKFPMPGDPATRR